MAERDEICSACDGSDFVDLDNGEGGTTSHRCLACCECTECEGRETITRGEHEITCPVCEGTGQRPIVDERRSRWTPAQMAAALRGSREMRGAA